MIKIKKVRAIFNFLTPFLIFSLVTIIFFKDYFFNGLIPIPGDIIIGSYYPWLNQKWDHAIGVAVKNPPMSDVVSLMYPWRFIAINYIKNYQLPLWDPTQFMGVSLIGNFQAAIFNPFNALFLLPFKFNWIWGFQVVVQPFIGLISMYLLIRSWKFSKLPAYFAAISYAFSAQMVIWCEYNLLGFIISVFPLFFYLINRFFESKKNLYLIFLSLLIAFSLFAGYPQLMYYSIFFISIYFLYQAFREKIDIKNMMLLWGKFLMMIILGLGIAAIQLLPGYEMTENSVRILDKTAWHNQSIYLPYENLITAFSPDFFGNPVTYNYWGLGYYESFAFYTSLVAIILAIFSFQNRKRHGLKILFFCILLFVFIFALDTPISNYFQKAGIFGLKGSVHARVLFVYAFCISILGAIGMESLIEEKLRKKLVRVLLIPVFIAGILILSFLLSKFTPSVFIDIHSSNKIIDHMQTGFRNTLFPFLISFSSATVILLYSYKRKKIILIFLLLILVVDILRFGNKYLPFTPENEIFPRTATMQYLEKSDGLFRMGIEKAELFPANTWTPYNFQSPSGYNILVPKDTLQFLSYLNHEQPDMENKRFVEVINFDSKLLDLINTKYVLSLLRLNSKPDPDGLLPSNMQNKKFKPVFQEGNVLTMQNTKALPRVFTVDKFLVVDSYKTALDYMISDQFIPEDEIVLDRAPGLESLSKCDLSIFRYTGQSYFIQSRCQGDSLLVLTESFDFGWKARVNGKSVTAFRADGNFIALPLKNGTSLVEIYYLPNSFILGTIISGVSIFLVIVFLIHEILKLFSYRQKRLL